MSEKKILPCLDIKDGRVVKGVKFKEHNDIASPVELAKKYNDEGASELVFYDITASIDGRQIFADIIGEVVNIITIPLIVGGGIYKLSDIERLISLGADKVSINTGALKNPNLLSDAEKEFGKQRIILAVDVKRVDGVFRIFTKGGIGGEDTGIDAIEWIKRGEGLGAGELVVNSIDTDGVKGGFDLPLLEAVSDAVSIPVIASGGAGSIDDFIELFKTLPTIDTGLAASIFHYDIVKIPELKQALKDNGFKVL